MEQSAWYRKYGYGLQLAQDAQTPNGGAGVQNLGGIEPEVQESHILSTAQVPPDVSLQFSSPAQKTNPTDWSTKYGQRRAQNAAEAVLGQDKVQTAEPQSAGIPNATGMGQDGQLSQSVDTAFPNKNPQPSGPGKRPVPSGGAIPNGKRMRVQEPTPHRTNEQFVSPVGSLPATHSNDMGTNLVQNAGKASQNEQRLPTIGAEPLNISSPSVASDHHLGLVEGAAQSRQDPAPSVRRVCGDSHPTRVEGMEPLGPEPQHMNAINPASAPLSSVHHQAQSLLVTPMTGTEATEGPGQNGRPMQVAKTSPLDTDPQHLRPPNSFSAPIQDCDNRAQAFDRPMTRTENMDQYNRDLPGDEMDDDLLNGYESDPDRRAHHAKLKKLRNDILDLRDGTMDDDDPLATMLDGAVSRRVGQKREPKPRGRQPGVKIGPRKNAELSGELKLRLSRAVALQLEEKYMEAKEELSEIIRINAETPVAWELLGAIFDDEGNKDLALRCLIYAANTSPKHPAPWITAAKLAISQQGPRRPEFLEQALLCYAGGIRADPQNLFCRRQKAAILEELGRRASAISEYKRILGRLPTDLDVLQKIAELCIDHGKCDVAIDAYKTTIAHFKKLPPELAAGFDWTHVDTYVTLHEIIGYFYIAISEIKSLSRWLLGREEDEFWDQVKHNDCEYDISESRRIHISGYMPGKHPPESYELPLEFRVKLGLYRLNTSEYDEAMHHLNFLDPENERTGSKIDEYPHLFQQVGDQLFKKRLYDEALRFYQPLVEVDDYSDSALLVQIGRCFLLTDREKLAEQMFRDAIEMDDSEIDARMELAKMHEDRNELRTALNLVNEVMLRRRGRKRRAIAENLDSAEENETTRRPRRPRTTLPKEPGTAQGVKPERRLLVLTKAEELNNHVQVFRRELDGMRAGDPEATKAWLEAAGGLTDDFRACRDFYPWDKFVTFLGYSGVSALHAATPLDADLGIIADRLQKNIGADLSLSKNSVTGGIPTHYRNRPFSEWLDIFMEYALALAKNGHVNESYEICEAMDDAVVWYHSREDKFLAHLCWAVCALIANDEEACVNQARFFMREYQFTTDSYRMYGALMRAIHSPVSWYSSGPSQKYILRQIKCMDLSLVDEERRKKNNFGEKGSYSAVDEKGHIIINEDMDVCLLMMYGHILYTGQSYAYALNYFLRAYALDTNNPMIHLCIGLAYTHHALKRQCENRQHHILQGLSFMMKYYNSRKDAEHLEERQEAHYNIGRIYHMLGMSHLAIPFYQKVLDEVQDGKRSDREDLCLDTAYNLQTMYSIAGNSELAMEITRRWLTI